MHRLTFIALALVLGIGRAHAESQAEIAAREYEEGKELTFASKYAEASAKFRDAVARVPEAKYFFGLCTSLYQEGKFGEALTACDHANQNNPDAKLKDKTDKLVAVINEQAKAQGIDLHPVGGGGGDPNQNPPVDPNQPNPPVDPNQPNPPVDPNQPPQQPAPVAVGRPPSVDVVHAVKPQHSYTWTLGIDLYAGGGSIGATNFYGNAAGGFRLKSDLLFAPAIKVGGEGYIQYTHFGASSNQVVMQGGAIDLDVIDAGVGLYKHFCLPGVERLCVTPLVGAHLALMSPANQMDATGSQVFNYAGFGARAEVSAHIGLGPRYEHVFGVALGVNAYTAALSSPTDAPAATFGLDTGGAFGYLSIGYTYRFNTPLGHAAFITLE